MLLLRRTIFTIIFGLSGVLTSQIANAQVDKQLVDLATEMYTYGDFEDAFHIYLQAISENENNVRAHFMAGQCLLKTTSRKGQAVSYFKAAYDLDPEISNKIFYLIGQAYHFNYQWDEAKNYYLLFKEELETNRRLFIGEDVEVLLEQVGRKIQECDNGKLFVSKEKKTEITNLGEAVNGAFQEYAPTLSQDGQTMIFTSRREGSTGGLKDQDNAFFEDIWITKKEGEEWGTAQQLAGKLNTDNHESNVGLSPDGNELYIYRSDNGGDIYVSEFNEGKNEWDKAKPFKLINTEARESSVNITPDGKYLFFASDKAGGIGAGDIYWCKKNGKKWSDPENLGNIINTEFEEDGPSFDVKTNTLYFSSNGHNGMGGFDIYFAKYNEESNVWSEPENLGYPVNTPQDDLHFIISEDSDVAYFASARKEDNFGKEDIYRIMPAHTDELANPDTSLTDSSDVAAKSDLGDKPVVFKLKVEGQDNPTIRVDFKMMRIEDEEKIDEVLLEDGSYERSFELEESKAFMVSLESEGYLFQTVKIDVPYMGHDTFYIEKLVVLKKPEIKKVNVLRNVYFEFDKHSINHASTSELNLLEKYLSDNPNVRIEIAGHTDYIGPDGYNEMLSTKRAKAVRNYLIKRGVEGSRITAKGYGEAKPLASNDDEDEGREINRRTEFIILSE